ncbi:MAG: hypothetical protein KAT65_10090 [Methanophagales archaeon]|nr:hypothetical protein [Methanophagales archaeon]
MNIKQKVLGIARKVHRDKELFYLYFKFFSPSKSLLINPRNVKYPTVDYNNSDLVLFPLLYGGRCTEMALQALLSHALNLRGVRTKFILCDRKLPICLSKVIDNINVNNCHYCYYVGKKFASKMNMSANWIGDFIKDENITDSNKFVSSLNFDEYYDLNYKGVNIGQYAEAATKRFLLTGVIEDREFDKSIFSKYLVSAALHVELSERILTTLKPTHLVISNIAYLPGIFVEYFSNNGVKCIGCDFGILNGHLKLNHLDKERKDILEISSKVWEKYSAQTLSDTHKKELEELLASRARGTGMQVDHGKFAQIKSKEGIANLLNIDIKKNIGILFTNLLWDASLARVDVVFKNPFEWIYETINWFARHDEKILVIKVHPAEEIHGTRLSFISYINSKFSELPENIILLPPKTEISTYSLFDVVNYGIVYTTTAGLEEAIRGIPVITAARTHYREKGFTFDATNKEQYFRLLESAEKLEMTPRMRDLANRYGYLQFCDREIPFKYIEFGEENFLSPELRLKDWHELLSGSDENLDMICDGIIYGEEFLKKNYEAKEEGYQG